MAFNDQVYDAELKAALGTVITKVSNQINRSVVGATFLELAPPDGKSVSWDAVVGTATPTTGPIADGAEVTTTNNDTTLPASLEYVTYHEAFSVSGRAIAAAASSGSPSAMMNLFNTKLRQATQRMARKIGYDFYNGAGSASEQVHGLVNGTVAAIGDTGTYAGIDRASYAQWQGNVVAGGGRTLTAGILRELRRKIYDACEMAPNLFLCNSFQHEKYAETFGTNRRYLQEVTMNGQTIKLDAGYNGLELDGIPVIEDNLVPAGMVIALNTDFARWWELPSGLPIANADGSVLLAGTPEEHTGARPLKFRASIRRLPYSGDLFRFGLYLYPCLQVERANACGYISGLATS